MRHLIRVMSREKDKKGHVEERTDLRKSKKDLSSQVKTQEVVLKS